MPLNINLTPKQLRILDVIRQWRRQHGYAPTMQEIAEQVGVTKVTVFEHVEALLRKGALRRDPHKARSLSVVDEAVPVTEPAASVSFPLVGRIAAGYPIERFPQHDSLALADMYAPRHGRTSSTFLLEADGDEMRDEGVLGGDFLVVEQRDTPTDGERIVVTLANGETIVRRYYHEQDGNIRLRGSVGVDEGMVVRGCKIHGIVLGVLRRYA